jgi:hypothetical protein
VPGLNGLGAGYSFATNASRGECAQILHSLLAQLPSGPTTTTTVTIPAPCTGDLVHAWFAPEGDWQQWQSENVSQLTGAGTVRARLGGLNSFEPFGDTQSERVWAVSAAGHLLMFEVTTGGHQWQVTDISAQTGHNVENLCDGDAQLTGTGSQQVLHLVARDASGELLHFSWKAGGSWQCENVSTVVGTKVSGRPTLFAPDLAPAGTLMTAAAAGTDGHLLLFHFGAAGWSLEDITTACGVTCGGFIRWEPFGTIDKDGHFCLLDRAPASSAWQVMDVLIGESGDLIHVWRDTQDAWHSENLSTVIGRKISSLCSRWWLTTGPASARIAIFAVTPENKLVAVWQNVPSGAWQVFDASAELGFDVYAWAIPAPTWSGGIQHLMLVRR